MFYFGNESNIALQPQKIYVGNDLNHARLARKIYVGDDNGIARIVWDYDSIDTSWANASWSTINHLLYLHYYRGIDISKYWSVGDIRRVFINEISSGNAGTYQPEQSVDLVILGINHDDLTSEISGKTKAAITVNTKDSLVNSFQPSGGYVGRWNTYDNKPNNNRKWCNEDFINALPIQLSSQIKEVQKYTCRYTTSSKDPDLTTSDKCFLLSDYEVTGMIPTVFNGKTYSSIYYGNNGTQYDYFKDAVNKKKGYGIDGTYNEWALRNGTVLISTPYWNYIKADGTFEISTLNKRGCSPAFCL